MPKRSSRRKPPADINQLAKYIVDRTTAETPAPADATPPATAKNPHAVALGKLGGAKGGKARAAKLSAEVRRAIAKKAARARWSKSAD